MKRHQGFGLSDVLISLLLSTLIIATLGQLYLANKKYYLHLEEELAYSFDLQWISDLLSDSIRRAGFTPCLGIDQLQTLDRRHQDTPLQSFYLGQSNDQFLTINRMSERFISLRAVPQSTQLSITNKKWFKTNRAVLVADCVHAEVHTVSNIEKSGKHYLLTLARPLHFVYPGKTYLGEWLEEQWFIQPNQQGHKALYYRLYQTEELSSLVHSLQSRQQPSKLHSAIEVNLGWGNNKTQRLFVAVRA